MYKSGREIWTERSRIVLFLNLFFYIEPPKIASSSFSVVARLVWPAHRVRLAVSHVILDSRNLKSLKSRSKHIIFGPIMVSSLPSPFSSNLFFAQFPQVLIVLFQLLDALQTSAVQFQQMVEPFVHLVELGLGRVQFIPQMVNRGQVELHKLNYTNIWWEHCNEN